VPRRLIPLLFLFIALTAIIPDPARAVLGTPRQAEAVALLLGTARAAENPPAQAPDDRSTGLAVENRLLLEQGVDAHRIDVEVRDGTVVLTGSVDSLLDKELASDVAAGVKGVRTVRNRLDVRPGRNASDRALRNDVREALERNPATEDYALTVAVEDGAVRLSGAMGSRSDKRMARAVVAGVRGVRAVDVADVSVTGVEERPDRAVEQAVLARLSLDPLLSTYGVSVQADDGHVTLRGEVASLAAKERAQELAWVSGVEAVDAHALRVDWTAAYRPPQARALELSQGADPEQAIQEAWQSDPRVRAFNLDVRVDNGVALLTGVVDNLAAKRAAGEDARELISVRRVRNHIKVRPQADRPDRELARAVERALKRHAAIPQREITVSASNGTVYLEGDVDYPSQALMAGDVAAGVRGVVAVQNGLEAYQGTSHVQDDLALKSEVDEQLEWSPFLDSGGVSVTVRDGRVVLQGTVNTWVGKYAAERNAYQAGAEAVDNRLEVKYGPDFYQP
jgi:osmotically-inducible protein OsmY